MTQTNVIVTDTLPSGVAFVSATPAQNSGPNPLVWRVGTLRPGEKFAATVTVKATGTGPLENQLNSTSNQSSSSVVDIVPSGSIPILSQSKVVSPATVSPGATVQYTITVDNIGSGPTASPVQVQEYLPTSLVLPIGFTFVSKDKVTVNGADVTALTTVNTTNPSQPLFSVPNALNAGQSLVIVFKALVPANMPTGSYCNAFTTTQGGVPETTGALACVTVGGGQIGDTIFRDWNGNGIQDPQDEGLPGVTVQLNTGATVVTDANGKYLFTGLTAGTYTVTVASGVPAGYTQTADPNGPPLSTSYTLTLATNQQNLTADFGFSPAAPAPSAIWFLKTRTRTPRSMAPTWASRMSPCICTKTRTTTASSMC